MTAPSVEPLAGWGRVHPVDAPVLRPTPSELADSPLVTGPLLGRGLGRSYGDAATPAAATTAVATSRCRGVDWVDRNAGIVRADAGVTIADLIDRFAPKGWFVPVSPGTRQVTVGGAIAADIHGKNHHVHGSFGPHVRSLRLRLADDSVVVTSPTERPELFWATVGGMGLTGIVIDAEVQLMAIPSTSVRVETTRFANLQDLLDEMRRSDALHSFSVAWVDLLTDGRSVLTQGDFAPAEDMTGAAGPHRRPPTPSISLPPIPIPKLVHTPFVRVFNEAWWRLAPAEPTVSQESITRFWHPLDAIADWNRLYGSAGFWQWQCVVPDDDHDGALHDVCDLLRDQPAFFTVLKRFGPGNPSPLSFPMPGWTLAVDLPVGDSVARLLHELDRRVVKAGGRIYLAKDGRMSKATFEAGYPRAEEFRVVRRSVDPGQRFRSSLSERLGL